MRRDVDAERLVFTLERFFFASLFGHVRSASIEAQFVVTRDPISRSPAAIDLRFTLR